MLVSDQNKQDTFEELSDRLYLTQDEIELLLKTAKTDTRIRHKQRDYTLILIGYRHGLRASEIVNLRWSDIDFKNRNIAINRVKGSRSGVHPLLNDEDRALKRLRELSKPSTYVFLSERGAPLTTRAVGFILEKVGRYAQMSIKIHPHQLRHTCGYLLANSAIDTRTIQDWLGHSNIQHTVRYTALAPERFKDIWHKS